MKWRTVVLMLCLGIQGFSLGGCAGQRKAAKPQDASEIHLASGFLEQALESERQGRFQEALEAYEAAAAVVAAKKKGLERSMRQAAERHYHRGLEFRKRGEHVKARREFLIALRLRPDFPAVIDLLKTAEPSPPPRYLVHEVKKGEVLTGIAQQYYKDQSKFELIARVNKLEDAAKLQPGMKLKIPKIEGMRSLSTQKKKTPGPKTNKKAPKNVSGTIEQEAERESALETAEEVARMNGDDQQALIGDMQEAFYHPENGEPPDAPIEEKDYDPVAVYQEQGVRFLEQGQYLAALHEFKKALNTEPSRKGVREYLSQAHYRQGEVLFRQGEYLDARNHFVEALSFDENCTSCSDQVKSCEDAYKEQHYLRGIQYFEEEKLDKAIDEWKLVTNFDSAYKQVQNYMGRAQKLLEKVQQLKESP